jgi:hypothetical protein
MNATSAIGWYLIEHKIDPVILTGFPKRLSELPPHLVTRLSANGMIRKHERIHQRGTWRWLWVAGPRLPGLLEWMGKRKVMK